MLVNELLEIINESLHFDISPVTNTSIKDLDIIKDNFLKDNVFNTIKRCINNFKIINTSFYLPHNILNEFYLSINIYASMTIF